LSVEVQQMVVDEMISSGHARTLLAITDPKLQLEVATKVFDEKLSVRETEKLIKHFYIVRFRIEYIELFTV